MKLIFCILALLCPYVYGLAQPLTAQKTGLAIGSTMPDVLLNNLKNYPSNSVSFSDIQKELTIIDFWASWCVSCVATFPKMHALQNKYAPHLRVLMVNASPDDNQKKLDAFFKRRKERTGKDFTLPYLVQDSLLSALFPYKVIPHYIWLDKNRKVLAITDGEAVSEGNIDALLSGQAPAMAFKNDALLFDAEKDNLLPQSDSIQSGRLLYHSFITGEQPGLGGKVSVESVNDSQIIRMRILNHPLISLYEVAFRNAFYPANGRLEIDPSVNALFEPDIYLERRTKFCYELFTKPLTRQQALASLATDLERYFKATAIAEEKWISSFVIKAGKNIQQLYSKNGPAGSDFNKESVDKFISNGITGELCSFLELVLKKPVLDETGLTQKIDIRFPPNFYSYSPQQVKTFLQGRGIKLEEAETLLTITRLTPITKQ